MCVCGVPTKMKSLHPAPVYADAATAYATAGGWVELAKNLSYVMFQDS